MYFLRTITISLTTSVSLSLSHVAFLSCNNAHVLHHGGGVNAFPFSSVLSFRKVAKKSSTTATSVLLAPPTKSRLFSTSSSSGSGEENGIVNANNVGGANANANASASDSAMEQQMKIPLRERLLKISNFASLLCVIDCTVLPAVTVLLPLIGLGAGPAATHWLHEFGHSVALFFVLPVGGLATTMNFLNHKKKSLLALALLGLSLVYAANGNGGPVLLMLNKLLPGKLAHDLHCCGSTLHRLTNMSGCACLLSSNYLSRKIGGCSVPHDHDHGSDCSECGDGDGKSHSHSHYQGEHI